MAQEFEANPEDFRLFEVEEYAALVADFLERLDTRIAVERFTSQSPKELLLAPDWGMKNYQFVELVKKILRSRGSYQGAGRRGTERVCWGHYVVVVSDSKFNKRPFVNHIYIIAKI